MSTVIKDLGAVSAYAYAVEKGYTGTEAEFAELMASYANVGQTAVDAAESALNSKTAAQTAATTATNKASEATTAAQTATTKAGEAQTSAQTASSKASEASQSASTASTKASEATTAATSANTAKTDAVAAKTAAETAQGKAEDAQAAAESVAESIPSDYSQLSEDVSDLKEDLSDVNERIGDVKSALNRAEENLGDLAEDGELTVLNPNNLFDDPTFAKGKWGAINGTFTVSDKEGSLSKLVSFTRINTSSGGYLVAVLPVSLFTNGSTYRIKISLETSTNSSIVAIRQNTNGNPDGSGTGRFIVTDASMIKDLQTSNRSDFHYDWTVDTSAFGTYNYIQIQFKITSSDPRKFFEPFIGLASGDTNYTVTYSLPTYTETLEPVNLFAGEYYADHRYGDAGYVSKSNFCCSKPQFLKAGTYLCPITRQYIGTALDNKVFKFASADGTVGWTERINVVAVGEAITYCGKTLELVNLYKFTINEECYVGCNIGLIELAKRFMIIKGSTLADFPESYVAYFEPHLVEKEPAKLNASMISEVSRLYGKTVAVNGDSICEGGGDHPDGFIMPVASRNGMIYSNIGVSGGTLASGATSGGSNRHWIAETIQNMPSGYDYYIFEGGVNDCANNVPVGTLSNIYPVKGADNDNIDKTTVIGAVEYACRDLVTIFAGKKYGYIFPHRIFPLTDSGQPHPWYTTYKPGIISALEKWGVPYLDLGNEVPPLNQIDSLKSVYTNNGDGWHPNAAGYEAFYTDKIKSWLESL